VQRASQAGRAQWFLRLAGIAGLGSSFAACVLHSGWSVGPVLWFGLLTVAALAVALTLTYRRHVTTGKRGSPPSRGQQLS
jgi:hypothetical protein